MKKFNSFIKCCTGEVFCFYNTDALYTDTDTDTNFSQRLQGTGGCGYVKKTFGDSGQQVPITVLPLTVYNVDLPPTSTLPVTAFFGTKTTPLPITALPSTLRPEV